MHFPYGKSQRFRRRCSDINVLGETNGPCLEACFQLNGGPEESFYVEPQPVPKGRYVCGGVSPSINRLSKRVGAFNVEIPVGHQSLRPGWNEIRVRLMNLEGCLEEDSLRLHWDPTPIPLPLELMAGEPLPDTAQAVGQAVDGVFEINRELGCIQSADPVGADVLFLLGSPGSSQEATYETRFTENGAGANFIGLSDFFVRHEMDDPTVKIKPGYSSAGLATIEPPALGRCWLSLGDLCAIRPDRWMLRNEEPRALDIRAQTWYRVRHQAWFDGVENWTRWRLWELGTKEPEHWHCELDTRGMDGELKRHPKFSFGLFQFGGPPTQWRNIKLDCLQ